MLVDVKDLDLICEKLDSRRLILESVPRGWPVRGILSSGFGCALPRSPTPPCSITGWTSSHDPSGGRGIRIGDGGEEQFRALLGNVVVLDHGSGIAPSTPTLPSGSSRKGRSWQRGKPLGTVANGADHRAPPSLRGPV